MLIDLLRTFSLSEDLDRTGNEEDWALYFGQHRGRRTWNDLHAVPLSIVIGEAGIGKTSEFTMEVDRLAGKGEAAFLLSLNQLTDTDSWQLVMTGQQLAYDNWVASSQVGYFFLDAVDEARLRSHADFEKALAVVQRTLEPHFHRVRIAISSRVTDWSVPAVQTAVDRRIASPLSRSLRAQEAVIETDAGGNATTVSSSGAESRVVEPLVVALDPLSLLEARRCAEAFDLQEPQQFWTTVSDGDYEFMATRPLDLRWMVALWNKRRTLGTYRELMDANIENRLQEFNESYVATGDTLSVDQLRTGAMELAAAAEFGDCAYFILEPGGLPGMGELTPQSVLSALGWGPQDVRRLLATAIFDEASYGRVKFHHRSIREYLAAEWAARQLKTGVPLLRLQALFVGQPFGAPVLVPARKAALSWLAALDVAAREWVVRALPEVLLSDGDPQAWDAPSAEMAFVRCREASKVGFRPGWHQSPSVCMRIGRTLPSGVVAAALADKTVPGDFTALCYQVAAHAKLADCTAVALADYRDATAPGWRRVLALRLLKQVGTGTHRQQVFVDLQAGLFSTNELVAEALTVVDWKGLAVPALAAIFSATHSEPDYGSGPMARLVKDVLLPETDLASASLVLEAVMAALPPPIPGKRFARFPESDRPERAWLLEVLLDAFERVLALLPPTSNASSSVCMEAAERVEAQRDSGFTDSEELRRLHAAIASHTKLRWDIALAIAHSEDIRASVSRLTWGSNCLVSMGEADMSELTRLANDSSQPPADRDVWQAVAIDVVFQQRSGHARARSLRALGPFPAGAPRAVMVDAQYRRWRAGAKARRTWATEELRRKAETATKLAGFKSRVTADLVGIANGSHGGWLQQLLGHSFNLSGRNDYSHVDFEALSVNLSPEIAAAFKAGLKEFWRTITPPEPSSFTEGRVPWTALLGLAGLRCSLAEPGAIPALLAAEVTKAAQLAVWNLNGPPDWFGALVDAHRSLVEAALAPWLVKEAQATAPGNGVRGALDMVLRSRTTVRAGMLAPLVPLVVGSLVPRQASLHELIGAMRADALLSSTAVCALCQNKLLTPATGGADMFWLRIWMEEDSVAAWAWFRGHIALMTTAADVEVTAFAKSMGDLKWLAEPLPQEQADLLLEVVSLLRAHPSPVASTAGDDDSLFFGPPSKRLCQAISQLFVHVRGAVGYRALLGLIACTTDSEELQRLRGQALEHAALDASAGATRTVEALRSIASPFLTEPKSEAQLYLQVIARLEEIRKNLEEGPFSERDLFSCGMPEKFLQRWLAAKFRETQNRRFSVHREEEVDDDKKTDIQLSCPAGNVCVEIKPVDATRYSATSLTETLKTQIVGQYLKGTNSSRGILVLMQLDDKTWDIPGGGKRQSFSVLVKYLNEQAYAIRTSSPGVNELAVFGIRCLV
jgi:hypothetical protein